MNRMTSFLNLCRSKVTPNRVQRPRVSLIGMTVGVAALLLAPLQRSNAATINVTTIEDKISSTGGCSLKEAIYSANFDNNIAIDSVNPDGTDHFIPTQCVPGSGDDVIVLPPGTIMSMTQITDDAHNPWGPTATPIIFTNITIDGYGAKLGWGIGGSAVMARAFTVGYASVNLPNGTTAQGFGNLTLTNTYIKGFTAKGGDGSAGGGGGLGAGGAVFVASSLPGGAPKFAASLTVVNSTFEANTAAGGNANPDCNSELCGDGGGGGGLGGDGGSALVGLNTGGGGGGGARGNGGGTSGFAGGGGGGTVTSGANVGENTGGASGFTCGGPGGDASDDGNDGSGASCPGGGGGGGGFAVNPINPFGTSVAGGNGNIGGGGGGAPNQGGNGGWGGGGGAADETSGAGGNGGFGGGGGAGEHGGITNSGSPGSGGKFGGSSTGFYGGGGAGLGGAIFNVGGFVDIVNSTFTANNAVGGRSPGDTSDVPGGFPGEGHGGAIFSINGSTTVENDTIDGNLASGSGGGIYIWQDTSPLDLFGIGNNTTTFILRNTIVADSSGSDDAANKQCTMNASVITGGDWRGNLIQNNDPSAPCDYTPSTGTVSTLEPLLGPLQNNGGYTPTMAIGESSPAFNTADATTSTLTDQRGSRRPELGGYDIGAYELCNLDPTVACPFELGHCIDLVSLNMQVSPPAGGTTSPPPGITLQCTGSVVSLVATPNPGYVFNGWTGNMSFPGNASTSLPMVEPQTVTANFVACNCAVNVSGSVTVTRGPIVLNPVTKRYAETVTVTNTSANMITGPLSLALDYLSSNATLVNGSGLTDLLEPPAGSPYVNASMNLAPGQMATFALQFADPSNTAISYTTRVLAGVGSR